MLLVSELVNTRPCAIPPDPAVFLVHAARVQSSLFGNTGECHDCALSEPESSVYGNRLRAELIIFILPSLNYLSLF